MTYNSWIILSKFTTAKRRDAMAAPEMRAKQTIRTSDDALLTVDAGRPVGNGYANGMTSN